jgi:hypothetical protein
MKELRGTDSSQLTSTSNGFRSEFSIQETDVYGGAVPYIWEASISGRLGGVYQTSRVLDEETGRGALGVQVTRGRCM